MADPAYLAVARLRKPHGLKGDVVLWALTDDPEGVLVAGRRLVPVSEEGERAGDEVVIERSRRYQRQWLVKFESIADRGVLEGWRNRLFGVAVEELAAPRDEEMYVYEMPGVSVRVGGEIIGRVIRLVEVAGGGGDLLAVDVGGREVLVPFRRPIVTRVDREAREIELDPPDGLLEL